MRFSMVAFIVVIAVLVVATAPVQAQLPPGATISGRIISEDRNPPIRRFLVVPANTPQPAAVEDIIMFFHFTDKLGNFIVSGLSDGEYLIVLEASPEAVVSPTPETFLVVQLGGGVRAAPAFRLTITAGQSIEGFDITVGRDPDIIVIPPGGFSPPNGLSGVGAPGAGIGGTGHDGGGAGSAGAYIGLGVAAAALLLFAGGGAYRLRGRRAR